LDAAYLDHRADAHDVEGPISETAIAVTAGSRMARKRARAVVTGARCIIYLDRNAAGDRRRAFESCKLGAEQGDVNGMHTLGWCFQKGVGVAADPSAAFDWFRAAAYAGRVGSQVGVAQMLLEGEGTKSDLDAARHYASLAQAAGAPEAAELLKQIAARRA
jgi:TPR repeat protein